ncbi:MAG: DUF5615 family PIN-like protein [Pseudomonadota bacterium]
MVWRFYVDESIARLVVDDLRQAGFDTKYARDLHKGAADEEAARDSVAQDRILITLDLDFGDLSVRQKAELKGVIILRSAYFARSPAEISKALGDAIEELGERLMGQITIIRPGQTRQRPLDQNNDGRE